MNNTAPQGYVFSNLREASCQPSQGENVEMSVAKPCAQSNACGVMDQLDFDKIGIRAKGFGLFFKAASTIK